MEIIGVDFSGAKSDQHTWLARGFLDNGALELRDCRPIGRAQLTDLLSGLPDEAVAALDFPFSVPLSFARFWKPEAASMPDLWTAAAAMELEEFIALRDEFVVQHGELKRQADIYHPECYSCLHKANPNLVPMTFRGMQMLHQLWADGCDGSINVPPLAPPPGRTAILLEAMPGAALKAFRLPYKGYKNGARALTLRQKILDGLTCIPLARLENLEGFRRLCLGRHDALDSVVAAVVAALWARDPSVFRCPPSEGSPGFDPGTLLEGWLYAPVFIRPPM
jgi:Protein of unknown function (DUF429)